MNHETQKICKNHGLTAHVPVTSKNLSKGSVCKICKSIRLSNRTRENKIRLVNYKGGKCEDCGYAKSMRALHFHHRDPATKSFTLGEKINRSYVSLQAEADKCALLCANCHSERHEEILSM